MSSTNLFFAHVDHQDLDRLNMGFVALERSDAGLGIQVPELDGHVV
jgi:hypothetical protein